MSLPVRRFERAVNYDDALWRAAAESAVDTSYWDIFGHERHVGREALQSILRSLGWNVDTFETLNEGRRNRFAEASTRGLPVTAVVSEREKWVPLTLPQSRAGSIGFQLQLDAGHSLSGTFDVSDLTQIDEVMLDEDKWSTYRLPVPAETPLGYHELTLTFDGQILARSQLIVSPDRAYLPERLANGGRTAGFNIALYGLRSARNWGCGDFTDLRNLTEWAAKEVGFSMIGLNPLHALSNRAPYNTSPYLPLSMYYKNLIYIDVESVPEFTCSSCARALLASPKVQQLIGHLREAEFVEYAEVDRLKRRFLKLLYREFRRSKDSERTRQFRAYCEREGDLLSNFATYCALDEALHKQDRNVWTWRNWPAAYQNPKSSETEAFAAAHARSVEAYKFIQFVIEEQLSAAQQHAKDCGMSIGLYHDLAVATDSCGSDLWAYPDHYVGGCRVGAPADDFSPQGQDWGFPPPNKETHRAEGYRLFRESIRKIVRHGGALRIDHVMRLYRLFWVPQNMLPAEGTYVRDYATDLMHVLALESVASQNIIIGEDLGTVTDEMRELFTRFGILSYRLFPFEKNYSTGEFKNSFEYPRQALVASSTHDLPTLAGFWQNRDIEARREAGTLDEAGYQNQVADRRREKQRILDVLHSEELLPASYTRSAAQLNELDGDLHNAVIAFLARTPSLILLLNQEDFTKRTDQQNLPGTTAQYPNWRSKMSIAIEDLEASPSRDYTAMFKFHLNNASRA